MNNSMTIITPQRRPGIGLIAAWQRRELLLMFVRRHIFSRYRQMFLGILWSVAEPLGSLLILTFVFGFVIKVDTGGLPYPLFAFSGLVGWWVFSKTTTAVTSSLLDNIGVISKVYFPRIILPLAVVGRELFDALILVGILLAISLVYGFVPHWQVLVLPVILLGAALLGLGCGLILAPLTVKFRDVRHILSLVLQAGMYATPIVYSATLVPAAIEPLYQMNPMYWIVEATRWALLNTPFALTLNFWISIGQSVAIVGAGLAVFGRLERISVDVQ
jgi:lipopolysaccharide transport system permease protein